MPERFVMFHDVDEERGYYNALAGTWLTETANIPEEFRFKEEKKVGIVILGCGGVGSNLAYLIARAYPERELTLVDFDTVEKKNLQRQFFKESDVGRNKAEALKDHLLEMNEELMINAMNIKIDEMSLGLFNKEDFAFLTTDNNLSKKIAGKFFEDFLLVNCEADIIEIKTELDKEEMKAWQIATGYNSTQTFRSNIMAANFAYHAWENGLKGVFKIPVQDVFDFVMSKEVNENAVGDKPRGGD